MPNLELCEQKPHFGEREGFVGDHVKACSIHLAELVRRSNRKEAFRQKYGDEGARRQLVREEIANNVVVVDLLFSYAKWVNFRPSSWFAQQGRNEKGKKHTQKEE